MKFKILLFLSLCVIANINCIEKTDQASSSSYQDFINDHDIFVKTVTDHLSIFMKSELFKSMDKNDIVKIVLDAILKETVSDEDYLKLTAEEQSNFRKHLEDKIHTIIL